MREAALDTLAGYAAQATGFSREAILDLTLRKAAEQLEHDLGGEERVLRRAALGDRAVLDALCEAVTVGETFFFRQPEHFRFIAARLAPIWAEEKRRDIRAWSAGCATGEEAYSLGACLLDVAPEGATVSVLGTDLLERNLAIARQATYGAWSRRVSGPMLHPVFTDEKAERATVTDRVRAATEFRAHNLLDGPPGLFDVVFCRNVLVYFTPDAQRRALRQLVQAVAPAGALFFGSMDMTQPLPELSLARPAELQIFWRKTNPQLETPKAVAKLPPPPAMPRRQPVVPVPLHLQALEHIESGDPRVAQAELENLSKLAPDYLPALLERALLHQREGEKIAAAKLMREVLRRAEALLPEEIVEGPEPLPARFYRDAAVTMLRGAGRELLRAESRGVTDEPEGGR
jgi:chemotaxis methyl-accepting protein methylase